VGWVFEVLYFEVPAIPPGEVTFAHTALDRKVAARTIAYIEDVLLAA